MSSNLLNLLNIHVQNSPTPQRAASSFAATPNGADRTLPVRLASAGSVPQTSEPHSSTQKYLLDLLTRPKVPPTSDATAPDDQTTKSLASPTPQLDSKPLAVPTVATPPITPRAGLFKYVNPFDQLHASLPLNGLSSSIHGSAAPAANMSVAEKLENVGQEVGDQAELALTHAESIGNAVKEEVDSNWSTAEDEDARLEEEEKVVVHNFPMKPFVTLTLTGAHTPRSFRLATWEKTTPVARFKKDFSHDDRCLATATQNHIAYAVPATDKKVASGFKIIRQDDGSNEHLWRTGQGQRVCSVQMGDGNTEEIVLGVGVEGALYYSRLEKDNIGATETFTMTLPSAEGPQPSDVPSMRTRARLSSTHAAAYFGAARGSHIHIISVADAIEAADSRAYFKDRGFKINTAKSCKDFCFSDDDSMIVSLDKSGKVKFWNIGDITSAIEGGRSDHITLQEPVHGLSVSSAKADSKFSPSSILLLDKERAHLKQAALRYMLVGFQQNQILQLWDLGLGKCVQEIRLPEGAVESSINSEAQKALCSVVYHPKSSIIVVGHPGRNSVYFVHLSAPKYNLETMTQSTYIAAVVNKDFKAVPKPENTAIMSGVREFSFSKAGQLRSLDILKTPFQSGEPNEQVFFEIYMTHSKGVLAIPVSAEDLGWDHKGKLVKPAEAVTSGVVIVTDLVIDAPVDHPRTTSSSSTTPAKAVLPPLPKQTTNATNGAKSIIQAKPQSLPKNDARSSMKLPDRASSPVKSDQTHKVSQTEPSQSKSVEPVVEAVPRKADSILPVLNGNHMSESAPQLQEQFTALYKKLDNDKRISEATGAAKQDAILRLVSSTLTENVESSLQRIVAANVQAILPALQQHVEATLRAALPTAVHKELPGALNSSPMRQAIVSDVSKAIGAEITQLGKHLESSITKQLNALTEQVKTLARDSKTSAGTTDQLKSISTSVNELGASNEVVIRRLAESEERVLAMLASMQQKQIQLEEALKVARASSPQELPVKEDSVSPEVQQLTEMLNKGQYEQATIAWLQSAQQAELFNQLFVRINPEYLKHVSPLVALSVSAAVTASLESNVEKRLEWLSSVISNVDVDDQETADVCPKIMDVLVQRLQGAYMQIAETQPVNQEVLRKIAALNRLISNTRSAFH